MKHFRLIQPTLFFCLLLTSLFEPLFAQNFIDNTALISTSFTSSQPVGVVDMNGDLLDDIVRMNASSLEIQFQQPDGSFVGAQSSMPYYPWGMCVADIDQNGYNDVVYGGQNEGSTNVQAVMMDATEQPTTNVTIPASIFIQGINLIDIDNDGWIDLYACHDNAANKTFKNIQGVLTEDPTMMPFSSASGNYGSNWCDYDNDGDSDVYISKCRLGVQDSTDIRRINLLWQQDQNGGFREVGGIAKVNDGSQSWSADFGDIDNDGDMDLFVLNHTSRNRMHLNVQFGGQYFFTEITNQAGLDFPVGPDWQVFFADFDNDGFLDLLVTGNGTNQIFHNNGDVTFTPLASPFPTANKILNAAFGDLNHDGHLDIYATFSSWANSSTDTDKLYLNDGSSGNNWVAFNLKGSESNINAVGARLEIYGSWGKQIREVQSGQGYGIMNTFTQHFGIGTATEIDSLVVKWPSGLSDSYPNVGVNQFHSIIECPDLVTLQEGIDNYSSGQSVTVLAKTGIEAANTIGLGAEATFQAGQYIELQEEFETDHSGVLTVKIGGCDE